MYSIKSRLTLVSMFVLVVIMLLTAIALEKAVVQQARQAEQSRLQILVYSLLAAVDRNRSGMSITVASERLFETSLMTADSGLYALLYNKQKQEIWRSRSLKLELPKVENLNPGDWQFKVLEFDKRSYFRLAFAIQWPNVEDRLQRYDVVVWQDASSYLDQLDRFRQTLWAWLIVTTIILLTIMYLVLVWSLRPLKQVGLEIKAIEDHKQSVFENDYPQEIKPLTENLNILLNREKYQRQRYRNAMDDLAHSLKTPLAVMKGLSEVSAPGKHEQQTLREQVERMDQIVSYQLQRASSVAAIKIFKPVDLVPLVDRIISALKKVYREKAVEIKINMPQVILLRMDEGDCLEVIGNLIDNAFKYCRDRVVISAEAREPGEMILTIEDNGRGLSPSEIEQILNRGTRLDQTSEGQGIGLAVVADIVKSYHIEMNFGAADLTGLKVELIFQTA